jgi:hypothetical protein
MTRWQAVVATGAVLTLATAGTMLAAPAALMAPAGATTEMVRPVILLLDDFEDGDDAGWTQVNRSWHVWQQTPGQNAYLLDGGYLPGACGRDGWTLTHAGDTTWTDYSLSADVDTSQGSWRNAELQLRVGTATSGSDTCLPVGYRLMVWTRYGSAPPKVALMRYDATSTAAVLADVNGTATNLTPGDETNAVRVDAYGAHLDVWVNGLKVISVVDPHPLVAGGIGLRGIWESRPLFDNVRVTEIGPPAISVPANLTVEATGPDGAAAEFTAEAVDWTGEPVTTACSPPSGTVLPFGASTVTCQAVDALGQVGAASFVVTVADTTPPVVVCSTPTPAFRVDEPATVTAEVSDTGSGPSAPLVSAPASTALSLWQSVPLVGTDLAGNVTTVECPYWVEPWTVTPFGPPVDGLPVVNQVKGGATVAMKFRVFDGTDELTDLATVHAFVPAPVSCETGAVVDDIETTGLGPTTLRYDETEGQFVQHWKTPKASSACYLVEVTARDGTSQQAWFRLK